jgi:hypothetical protein
MLVQGVLAPHSVEILFNDLKDGTYFSVVTDTSNQRNTECYPTVVKYFSEKTGVKELFTKILMEQPLLFLVKFYVNTN